MDLHHIFDTYSFSNLLSYGLDAPKVLGRICKAPPSHDSRDEPHRLIVSRPFFVPRGEASKRLIPVDQPLNFVAFARADAVEGPGAMLVGLVGNRVPDPLTTQVVPHLTTTIRFVTDESVRSAFRPPWAPTLHGAAGHELGQDHRFLPWAWCPQQGQERPGAFSPEVDVRAEAPSTTPERCGLGSPF